MTHYPKYAVIRVHPGPGAAAWPIVQRVPGGWQSGAHHYPDAEVHEVRPLHLVEPRGSSNDEPLWHITVAVPMRLSDDQRDALFTAVADAVHGWEPAVRDGWDADVSAGPADDAPEGDRS